MSTDDLVKQLRELGIPEKSAKYALNKHNGDVTKAADYALSGNAGKDEASNLILGALGRPPSADTNRRTSGGGGLFGIKPSSPTPTTPPAEEKAPKVAIQRSTPVGGSSEKSSQGPRAPSPFFRARRSRDQARARDTSPEVAALPKDKDQVPEPESDGESIGAPKRYRPQASAYEDGDESATEAESSESGEEADEDEDEIDVFDEETEKNTEANAVFYEGDAAGLAGPTSVIEDPVEDDDRSVLDKFGEEIEQDPLGEGPNVVVPPVPAFAAPTQNAPKRRKSLKTGLELTIGRPSFARDRCTITISQGDPDGALEASGKRLRRYVVLSDLSDESRYAVEWAIGTVARDGDELFVISVKEEESKVDPKSWPNSDKAKKLLIQKERQTTTLLLVRQVTSLLQRTHLNITVTCQFLHAKNARHMLLDLIDFLEPTMAIVGSRGLGKLNSILLGSTSHYLVQKSSVPVMVARRRLQRPLRKTNPADLRHSPRVSLASASIEKTASSKQEDEDIDVANEAETPGGGASGDRVVDGAVVAGADK